MSSDWQSTPLPSGGPLPQDDFAEAPLVVETEPQADGSDRALLYPPEVSDAEAPTHWLAAPESLLVSLDEVQ